MWHFSMKYKTLGYNDGRAIEAGKTLTVDGEIELCKFGLHASPRLIDALRYAPGPYIWKVELSGEVIHGDDKSVASERKALWGYDATEVLRAFSRRVALDAVETHWDAEKFGEFPAVAMEFLKTGKGSPSAVKAAAYAANKASSYAAYAADNAAKDAAYAAKDAANAVYAAAYAAYAAYAAKDAANAVYAAAYAAYAANKTAAKAASYAASYAAYAADSASYAADSASYAAKNKYNTWLEEMILEGRDN